MLLDPYEFQPITITNIVRESEKAVSVQLATPRSYMFSSGQHAVVRVSFEGKSLMRQYSFSSAPSSDEVWLTIVETPDGAVSTWFNQTAKIGDSVELSRPFTGPLVHDLLRGQICMIAGGSGIAPLMSLLREHRITRDASAVTLLYSTRSAERCFPEELSPMRNETIVVQLSDVAGRLTKTNVTNAIQDHVSIFICGSRSFVTDMRAICAEASPRAAIYSEAFTLN